MTSRRFRAVVSIKPGAGFPPSTYQRAAVSQHHVERRVAAERVIPGQPVAQDRWRLLEKRPDLRPALLIATQHALGIDHAFGRAGGARCEQDLRDGVRPDRGERLVHACACLGLEQRIERRRRRADGLQGLSEASRILGEHQSRPQQIEDRSELRVVARHERIRGGDRRDRYARMHRPEREQGMVHGVVRQDGDRGGRRQPAGEE